VGPHVDDGDAAVGLAVVPEMESRRFTYEQDVLRRVAKLVADGTSPEQVSVPVTVDMGRMLDVDLTVIGRYDADGAVTILGRWTRSGLRCQCLRATDYAAPTRLRVCSTWVVRCVLRTTPTTSRDGARSGLGTAVGREPLFPFARALGSTARSERTANWNRLLLIEPELGADTAFAGSTASHRPSAELRPRRLAVVAVGTYSQSRVAKIPYIAQRWGRSRAVSKCWLGELSSR
jgi:hypothetical protein